MFHRIPQAVLNRMAYLEALDAHDRQSGAPLAQRLRQIPPETGRFLALLAAAAPPGAVVEVGTSGGYSGLWLALACRARGDRLITFDNDPNKHRLAQETFVAAGMLGTVEAVLGDAAEQLKDFPPVAFCFLDTEKFLYPIIYELVTPRLVPGGMLVADNVLSHQEQLKGFCDAALTDERIDAQIVPIGKGLLLCRRSGMA